MAVAVVLAVVVLAALVGAAGAEQPTEATTFGADGVAASNLGTRPYPAELTEVTARPDGGFVVRQGDHLDSYLADGAPDPAAPPVVVPAGQDLPGGGRQELCARRA